MILLILLASILIITVTIYQYDEQTKEYNIKRFGRKEQATKKSIEIHLNKKTTYPVITENLVHIFQDRIFEISEILNLEITMYDLEGKLLKTSIPLDFKQIALDSLSKNDITRLKERPDKRIFEVIEGKKTSLETSYTYILDPLSKSIGILKLEFNQDNVEQEQELQEFLSRLSLVYFFMFLIAITLAYFLSSYITRSIKTISAKMQQTRLNKRNEKIILDATSSELDILVEAYNSMIDELEESAVKLAQSEREQAWREMAKQVAHEIKNPLTPMRLSVQSFERRFDVNDPKINEKVKEYSETLIQQIDVMNSIASAFSDFAKMPKQKREKIEVIGVVKMALDIFNEDYVSYHHTENELYGNLDKTQLIRIVTNLITNANQASEEEENPKIEVKVSSREDKIIIEVSDNGKGIGKDVEHLIFEPKLTTKSSGMGLGLPMINNIIEAYEGSINFTSEEGKGTVFTVILPKT
ncbi:MAG: GHKL domain-containing protein [Flavobacteriaceae bacterium]|nr:GHKL domain-containing protein [Flavobacteriaceae bacterium]